MRQTEYTVRSCAVLRRFAVNRGDALARLYQIPLAGLFSVVNGVVLPR